MMQLDFERTIVALSSPLAPGQRAIVRLTGSGTRELLEAALREPRHGTDLESTESRTQLNQLFTSKQPVFCPAAIDLNWEGRSIDAGVYYWPTTRSFTGQPSAELHFLGSLPLAQKVIERLTLLGAHPAERGEFSLRSFLAGKMDLVQAEAVLGVIESVVGEQLHWALSQLGGNLSQPVRELRLELMNLLADLEAGLDFVEEDIEFITDDQTLARLDEMLARLNILVSELESRGSPVRPLQIVLVGLPNAGKSSLFNALLNHDRSITSEQSGTTRDAVVSSLLLGEDEQQFASLVDTAGLEPVDGDSPRAVAQTVLQNRILQSDLALFCVDLSDPPTTDWIAQQVHRLSETGVKVLCVGTKADLRIDADCEDGGHLSRFLTPVVSVKQGETIQSLRELLAQELAEQVSQRFTQATHHTAVRFRHALIKAIGSLERAEELLNAREGHELVASELHAALDDLGAIIGEVHNDDILGQIFGRFCIGK